MAALLGARFGELTVHPFSPNADDAPALIKLDNHEGNPPALTDVWHSDESFREEPPMATALCAKNVPEIGGDTMYASMAAAYEGLSDRMQHLISGLEAPTAGRFEILGDTITAASPAAMLKRGVGRVPEDRHAIGVVGDFTVEENLVLEAYGRGRFSRFGQVSVVIVEIVICRVDGS